MTKVIAYSHAALKNLFSEYCDKRARKGTPGATNHHVADKHHISYLHGYLEKLRCATIIVEDQYIDRDFLEDFAAYHVRSFHPYRRHCARLHFFDTLVEQSEFDALIASPIDGELKDGGKEQAFAAAYLGFVVVKPLPSTVVGRTCLKTYGDDGADRRLYPVAGCEQVSLYGIPLAVHTLPFQEQDRDVAACASSALWSVFYATGRRFQHAIPSPVQITAAATQRAGYEDRVLPNGNGLTSRQMADAIRSVGLEPFMIGLTYKGPGTGSASEPANRILKLKIAIAAYLRAGIPCLLLSRMHEKRDNGKHFLGNHAMALTGYRMGTGDAEPYGDTGIHFDASRVTRFYAHDDQVGPFASMRVETDGYILTSQVNGNGKRFEIVAEPLTLMVPLYHKIRIPFNQIVELAISIDDQINVMREAGAYAPPEILARPIIWDLQLRKLDEYRVQLRKSNLAPTDKTKALTSFMPRFIWQLSAASSDGKPLFDLLFDPTDLLQGRLFLDTVPYDEEAFHFAANAMLCIDPKDWPALPLSSLHAHLTEIVAASFA